MPIQILMPALSPTMTEGNVASWLKNEGDSVQAGDILCEIETDKATMEVEATDEGTLGRIVVPAGTEGVAVNAVIGLILEEGEDASALEGGEAAAPAAAPQAAPAAEAAPAPKRGPAAALQPKQRPLHRQRHSPGATARRRPRLPASQVPASSRARWRAAWRSRPASLSNPSPAPAPTGAS